MRKLSLFLAGALILHLIPFTGLLVVFDRLTELGHDWLFVVAFESALFLIAFLLSLITLHRRHAHLLSNQMP